MQHALDVEHVQSTQAALSESTAHPPTPVATRLPAETPPVVVPPATAPPAPPPPSAPPVTLLTVPGTATEVHATAAAEPEEAESPGPDEAEVEESAKTPVSAPSPALSPPLAVGGGPGALALLVPRMWSPPMGAVAPLVQAPTLG